MATRKQLRSDLILRWTQGRPSDDFPIPDKQIDFWLDRVRASLIQQELDSNNTIDLNSYLTFLPCQDIEEYSTDCSDCDKYRVSIPEVINSKRDIGVYSVETESGDTIKRVRPNEVKRFKALRWGGIDVSQPSYYRVGNYLYIVGGLQTFLSNGKVNLYLVLSDTSSISDEEEYPIGADLLPILLDSIEQKGLMELGTIKDDLNDGE